MSMSTLCFVMAILSIVGIMPVVLNDVKDVPLREDFDEKEKTNLVLFRKIMIVFGILVAIFSIVAGLLMRFKVIV